MTTSSSSTPDNRPETPAPALDGIEAVCFDLDETLIDSAVAWRTGFVDAFAAEALPRYPALETVPDIYQALQPFFLAEVEAQAGSWGEFVVRDAIRKFIRVHAEQDDACADRTYEAYLDIWPRHIGLFPDALAAVDAARERARVALITNGPSKEQRLKLERTDLLDRFEVITISGEAGCEKPAAEIFAQTLASMGVAPEAALHIGDSLRYDVAGARAAGLTAVWLNRLGTSHTPDAARPHHEVADLEAFAALLAQ
jgi:putative hydrolase of the HAD superfamily